MVNGKNATPCCAFVSGFAPKENLGETSDYMYSRITVRDGTHVVWDTGDPGGNSEGTDTVLPEPVVIDTFEIVAPTHGAFERLAGRNKSTGSDRSEKITKRDEINLRRE